MDNLTAENIRHLSTEIKNVFDAAYAESMSRVFIYIIDAIKNNYNSVTINEYMIHAAMVQKLHSLGYQVIRHKDKYSYTISW